jgi:hypothetical protein
VIGRSGDFAIEKQEPGCHWHITVLPLRGNTKVPRVARDDNCRVRLPLFEDHSHRSYDHGESDGVIPLYWLFKVEHRKHREHD